MDLFGCLDSPQRRMILAALEEKTRTVTELAGLIGLSQPSATRHVQMLEREKLVATSRRAQYVDVALDHEGVKQALFKVVEKFPCLERLLRERVPFSGSTTPLDNEADALEEMR